MVEFVHRCRERMGQLGFDEDGSIHRAFEKAYDTLQELNAVLFCKSHGFEPAKPPPEPRRVIRAKDQAQAPPGSPGA